MKKLAYLLSIGVLVSLLATVGCKKDDDVAISPEDQVGAKLTGTWVINGSANSVTFGSPTEDRTTDYSDFTLTITYDVDSDGGTYGISGGPVGARPFPVSGTWLYQNDITDVNGSFVIVRDDGVATTISSLTDTALVFSFLFDSSSNTGSRQAAVDGQWNFSMVAQ